MWSRLRPPRLPTAEAYVCRGRPARRMCAFVERAITFVTFDAHGKPVEVESNIRMGSRDEGVFFRVITPRSSCMDGEGPTKKYYDHPNTYLDGIQGQKAVKQDVAQKWQAGNQSARSDMATGLGGHVESSAQRAEPSATGLSGAALGATPPTAA